MQTFRVRVWLSESNYNDMMLSADSWFNAVAVGKGMSPVGKAVLM